MFFITNSNLFNFADDNTLYAIDKNLHSVKSNLQTNFAVTRKCFFENHIGLNPGRSHYMLIDNGDQLDKINLNSTEITSNND